MPKYWGKQIFAHGRFPEVGQKQKTEREKEREYSRDCGWPRRPGPNAGHKKQKKRPKISFFCIYLLVMPKYWGEQIFTHGRFPEVEQWPSYAWRTQARMAHVSRPGQQWLATYCNATSGNARIAA